MSLGTPTINVDVNRKEGGRELLMSFDGDDSTPSGGTADFTDFVRDAIKATNAAKTDSNVRGEESVQPYAVIAQDCGVYKPIYDAANDKLKILNMTDGTEATGNLSTTEYNVLVLCK